MTIEVSRVVMRRVTQNMVIEMKKKMVMFKGRATEVGVMRRAARMVVKRTMIMEYRGVPVSTHTNKITELIILPIFR